MVKDLPANTGDVGSIPGTWRTPYTVGQPSPGATTPEPAHHRACALQQEKPCDEKALHNQESSPYSLQLEKACVAKRLSTAKKTPKTPNKYMHNIPTHAFRLHTTHLTCSVVGQPVIFPLTFTTKYSRLMNFPSPSSRISHFSRGPSFREGQFLNSIFKCYNV